MNHPPTPLHDPAWPETLATVTACTYRFGSLAVMAFGIPDRNHFLIDFTYEVARHTYTGQFPSPTAIAQGSTFPIAYNPSAPNENSRVLTQP